MTNSVLKRIGMIWVRELKILSSRPLYLFAEILLPVFVSIFFISLLWEGSANDIPIAIVDQDHTKTSRSIARTLNTLKSTKIIMEAKDYAEARGALQNGDIYGIYYIPENFEKDLMAQRQPTISFYMNSSYYIPGSMLMSDMTTASVLAQAAVGKQLMEAKGMSEDMIMGLIQPINVNTHPINNPGLDYRKYLEIILLPGIYCILVMILTVYIMGREVKMGTSRELLQIAEGNIPLAVFAKLLPTSTIMCLTVCAMNAIMFGVMGYPCQCGLGTMLVSGILLVLAAQSMALFYYGLFPILKFSISMSSFWGVLSISMSSFTFPVAMMPYPLSAWKYLFPLYNYFMIYVDEALNGRGFYYCWPNYIFLLCMLLLPLMVMPLIRKTYEKMEYVA